MRVIIAGRVYVALTSEQKKLKRQYLLKQRQQTDTAIPTLEEVLEYHRRSEQNDPLDYGSDFNTELDDWSVLNWLWDQADAELTTQLEDEDQHEELIEQYREEAEEAHQRELGQEYIDGRIEVLYRSALDRLDELDGHDCWRRVNLYVGFDPAKQDPLGIYWSYRAQGADTYWGHKMEGQGVSVMYRARVDTSYVNKRETVLANTQIFMNQGDGEAEVQFYPGAPIFVHDVTLEDGSVLEINDWRTT